MAMAKASMNDGSVREGASYNNPVFNDSISGQYVIPGTQSTGSIANFNFPG